VSRRIQLCLVCRNATRVRQLVAETLVLSALAILAAGPARATDYFVRTDGNNSSAGLHTASGAWASVTKCVSTLREVTAA